MSCRRSTVQKASLGITLITLITLVVLISSVRSPQHCSTYWMKNASMSTFLYIHLHLADTLSDGAFNISSYELCKVSIMFVVRVILKIIY